MTWQEMCFCSLFLLCICGILYINSQSSTNSTKPRAAAPLSPPAQSAIPTSTNFQQCPGKSGKYEQRCREILQSRFHRPFACARPDLLKNPLTGRNLECDMFEPDLKICVEYQGVQHVKFTPAFHKSLKDFEAQVQRDQVKRTLLQKHGYTLVEIPHSIPYNRLEGYLDEHMKQLSRTY